MFLLRLSPLVPYVLLNYALALSGVRFKDFVLATVGMLPAIVMYAYYGKIVGDVAKLAAGVSPPRGIEYWTLVGVGLVATIAGDVDDHASGPPRDGAAADRRDARRVDARVGRRRACRGGCRGSTPRDRPPSSQQLPATAASTSSRPVDRRRHRALPCAAPATSITIARELEDRARRQRDSPTFAASEPPPSRPTIKVGPAASMPVDRAQDRP